MRVFGEAGGRGEERPGGENEMNATYVLVLFISWAGVSGCRSQDPTKWYEQPEWVLVIVGIITFIIMGWQSRETRKAARAALLNATAVINSERARILFETEKRLDNEPFRGVATFTIFAVNRGKVPAEIINYGKAYEIAIT